MPKRNSPKDIKDLDDLNRLNEIVNDKRLEKRENDKKTRRNRHYEKQFIKNTIQEKLKKTEKMNKEETIEKLKAIVKPYVKDEIAFNNLDENTDFISDLKINSANLVDVVLDIEEQFEILIDNESMEKMLNVKAALIIIENKLSEK
jgi:acyl carrier protein